MPLIEFEPKESRYGHGGHNAIINGKYVIGWVGWNKLMSDQAPYQATCRLPGIKEYLGRFDTEEEARKLMIDVAGMWIKNAGLTAT